VGALRKRAEAEGGFATILAKGEPSVGAVLLVLVEPDGSERIVERILQPDGRYAWQPTGNPGAANAEDARRFLARRRDFDPDLWILELTVASSQRFIDELNEVV